MKQVIYVTLAILLWSSCKKEPDPPQTNSEPTYTVFPGRLPERVGTATLTSDGDIIMCANWDDKISIIKTKIDGQLVFRENYLIEELNYNLAVAELNGDIYILATDHNYGGTFKDQLLLIKADAQGKILWTKNYGGVHKEFSDNIIATSDGHLLLLGRSWNNSSDEYSDIYLVKVDTAGNTKWKNSYPDVGQEFAHGIMETQDGNYVLSGFNDDVIGETQIMLMKVDHDGQQLWFKKIGPTNGNEGHKTIELSNHDLVTCGLYNGDGLSETLILKTTSEGDEIWTKHYGTDGNYDDAFDIKADQDGSLTISGDSYHYASQVTKVKLLKTDAQGEPIWNMQFGGGFRSAGLNLFKNDNDDNIVVGNLGRDIFRALIDKNGNVY